MRVFVYRDQEEMGRPGILTHPCCPNGNCYTIQPHLAERVAMGIRCACSRSYLVGLDEPWSGAIAFSSRELPIGEKEFLDRWDARCKRMHIQDPRFPHPGLPWMKRELAILLDVAGSHPLGTVFERAEDVIRPIASSTGNT